MKGRWGLGKSVLFTNYASVPGPVWELKSPELLTVTAGTYSVPAVGKPPCGGGGGGVFLKLYVHLNLPAKASGSLFSSIIPTPCPDLMGGAQRALFYLLK